MSMLPYEVEGHRNAMEVLPRIDIAQSILIAALYLTRLHVGAEAHCIAAARHRGDAPLAGSCQLPRKRADMGVGPPNVQSPHIQRS